MKQYLCMFLAIVFGRSYKKYCEAITSDDVTIDPNAPPKYTCLVCNCQHKVVGLRGDDKEWFERSLEANKRLRMTRQERERKKNAEALKKQQESLNSRNAFSKRDWVVKNGKLSISSKSLERWLA